jgi:Uma2 family endonuclease
VASVVNESTSLTAADLYQRLGPIRLDRVVLDPPPGSATVDDVLRLDAHEDKLCELIDGLLVRKTVGIYESYLAVQLAALLHEIVDAKKLGIVVGEAGMMQILPDQVRIPDVAFVSWERLKQSDFPREAAPHVAPDLAVEIIGRGNTPQEMQRKLEDYFAAGVRMVWYIYPAQREVHVYRGVEAATVLGEVDALTGGDVLPGFTLPLAGFFATPSQA